MENEGSTIQEEIVTLMEKLKENINKAKENGLCKKGVWNKYKGDVCVRIFGEFISREISSGTVSCPNAYIEGYPTEFDLLVVDKNASPLKYTNAYLPENVKCGFEIKALGTGYGKSKGTGDGESSVEKDVQKIKDNFDAVQRNYKHINFVYLTYEDTAFPKRKDSIRYWEVTKRKLEPYKAFCLRDFRTKKPVDKWEDLVSYLNTL